MTKFIAVSVLAVILLWGAPGLIETAAAVEGNLPTAGEKPIKSEKLGMLYLRLNGSLERTTQLLARANSLIAKFESRGIDMTQAKTAATEAAAAIERAKMELGALQTSMLEKSTPAVSLTRFKQVGSGAVKAVRAAHAKVVAVISAVKASSGRPLKLNPTPLSPTPVSPTATPTVIN